MPVSQARGPGRIGIDDDEPGALATGLFDHGPEMDVVAMDVGSPGDDEAGVAEGFGVGAELAAVYGQERVASGGGADGAIELRGSEAMEEAAIHGAVSQDADGAGVGIGQDRFGSVLVADLLEARGDDVERFVPGDALECLMLAALRE